MDNLETECKSDVEDTELSQSQTQYMVVDIGGERQISLYVIRVHVFRNEIMIESNCD